MSVTKNEKAFICIFMYVLFVLYVFFFLWQFLTNSLSELTSHEFKSEVQEFLRHLNCRERDPQRVQRKAAHIVMPEGLNMFHTHIHTQTNVHLRYEQAR